MQCDLIAFYPQENFLYNWSHSSQTCHWFIKWNVCNILYYLLSFKHFHSIFIRSSFFLKKLSLLIHKKQLLMCESLSWECGSSVTSSGYNLILVFLMLLPLKYFYFFHWNLEPLKVASMRLGIIFLPTILRLIFWPLPMQNNCS